MKKENKWGDNDIPFMPRMELSREFQFHIKTLFIVWNFSYKNLNIDTTAVSSGHNKNQAGIESTFLVPLKLRFTSLPYKIYITTLKGF